MTDADQRREIAHELGPVRGAIAAKQPQSGQQLPPLGEEHHLAIHHLKPARRRQVIQHVGRQLADLLRGHDRLLVLGGVR
jgi:hypothetical protein